MAHQYYCRPGDGKPVPLAVQSFEDPDRLSSTSKWSRLGKPSFRMPSLTVISFWIWSSILKEGSEDWNLSWVGCLIALLKTCVTWPLLLILSGASDFRVQLDPSFYGFSFMHEDLRSFSIWEPKSYDPIPNTGESDNQHISSRLSSIHTDGSAMAGAVTPRNRDEIGLSTLQQAANRDRALSLRPRFLCFIDDPDQGTYSTRKVVDYIAEQGDHVDTEFVFVSYTRLQFLVATEEEIDRYQYPNEATREASRTIAKRDRKALIRWGIDSALSVGKRAFWLDFECVRDADGVARSSSSSDDVYRICDVVRAAHSMIIAIGPPVEAKIKASLAGQELPAYRPELITPWLRQWGSRLWTLPELLLCPSENRIKLYVAGSSEPPRALAKRNFAERAWDDGDMVKELVDHYEGSAILSPLRLMDVALGCFARRKTDQFHGGDLAYAIMGLLPDRLRPVVDNADSGFQAFARLSLSNDEQRVLERLVCIMPRKREAAWFDTQDRWGARLTEINPICHVADIVDSDTILLGGALGAIIQWDNLDPLLSKPPASHSGKVACQLLYVVSTLLILIPKILIILLCILKGSEFDRRPVRRHPILLPLFTIWVLFCLAVPLILVWTRALTGASTRAQFLGIEGSVDLGTIERYLFGFNYGRLTETQDFAAYSDADHEGETRERAAPTDEHAFTLIDTHLMTVSRFYSKRAPVAVLICGQEGGMQRALLCSYDHDTRTFVRETIIRMNTRVLDRMQRVDRLRFSPNLRSDSQPISDCERGAKATLDGSGPRINVEPSSTIHQPAKVKFQEDGLLTWRVDYALMLTMMFLFVSHLSIRSPPQAFTVIYYLAFLATQIPAYFLIQKIAMQRLLPCAVFVKLIAIAFLTPRAIYYDDRSVFLSAWPIGVAVAAIADGLITPSLVVLSWAWYTPRQLSLRIITWALVGPGLLRILSFYWSDAQHAFFRWPILTGYLFTFMACFGMGDFGLPRQVRWIPMDEQERILRLAAAPPYAKPGAGSARWQQRQNFLIMRYTLPTLVFAISLAGTLVSRRGWSGRSQQEVFYLIMVLCIGVFLYQFPALTVQVMIMCAVIFVSADALSVLRVVDVVFLKRLASLVIPLLWVTLAQSSSVWAFRVKMLFVSLVGQTIGEFILFTVNEEFWTTFVTLAIATAQVLLLVGLWGYQCWVSRRTAKVNREEPVSEQFADDPIIAHTDSLIG